MCEILIISHVTAGGNTTSVRSLDKRNRQHQLSVNQTCEQLTASTGRGQRSWSRNQWMTLNWKRRTITSETSHIFEGGQIVLLYWLGPEGYLIWWALKWEHEQSADPAVHRPTFSFTGNSLTKTSTWTGLENLDILSVCFQHVWSSGLRGLQEPNRPIKLLAPNIRNPTYKGNVDIGGYCKRLLLLKRVSSIYSKLVHWAYRSGKYWCYS